MEIKVTKIEQLKTGQEFRAVISNITSVGKIFRKGTNVWLCQDTIDGTSSPNKLGYKFSYVINGQGAAFDRYMKQWLKDFYLTNQAPALDDYDIY